MSPLSFSRIFLINLHALLTSSVDNFVVLFTVTLNCTGIKHNVLVVTFHLFTGAILCVFLFIKYILQYVRTPTYTYKNINYINIYISLNVPLQKH